MNGSPFLPSSHLESSKKHQEEEKSQRVKDLSVPSPTSSIKSVKCQATLPLPFLQTTRVETMHQPLDAENVTQVSQVDVSAEKRNRSLGEEAAFLQENKKLYRLLRSLWWSLERKSLMLVWIVINCLIFWLSYKDYKHNPKYFYIHKMLGSGLCYSRGTASVLNFACFMIFIPMCRTFLTSLRSTASNIQSSVRQTSCASNPPQKNPSSNYSYPSVGVHPVSFALMWLFVILPQRSVLFFTDVIIHLVDQRQKLHVYCAATIIIASICHTVAHGMNAVNFSRYFNQDLPGLNVARFKGQDPVEIIFYSMPGITGILMVVVLLILTISALELIRKRYYDVFWLAHRLFIVFVILLLIHPLSGLLKEQINTDRHYPPCPSISYVHENSTLTSTKLPLKVSEVCFEPPKFKSLESGTWKWLAAALTIYFIDFLFRVASRRRASQVIDATVFPSIGVVHLDVLSPTSLVKEWTFSDSYCSSLTCLLNPFVKGKSSQKRNCLQHSSPSSRPGDFVYIKCPDISIVQWHPFSLTPAVCERPSFGLDIKAAGDWSNKLKEKMEQEKRIFAFNQSNLCQWKMCSCNGELETSSGLQSPTQSPFSSFPGNVSLYVDGPFSSPTQDVFNFKMSVCIAGGIGITPFSSILSTLVHESYQLEKFKLRKLWLIWVVKTLDSMEFFADFLARIDHQLKERHDQLKDLLQIELFVTREGEGNEPKLTRNHQEQPEMNCSLIKEMSSQSSSNTSSSSSRPSPSSSRPSSSSERAASVFTSPSLSLGRKHCTSSLSQSHLSPSHCILYPALYPSTFVEMSSLKSVVRHEKKVGVETTKSAREEEVFSLSDKVDMTCERNNESVNFTKDTIDFTRGSTTTTRISRGKPNWAQLFAILDRHSKEMGNCRIGVFCCGPRSLRKDIKRITRKSCVNGGRFVLKPEDFGS